MNANQSKPSYYSHLLKQNWISQSTIKDGEKECFANKKKAKKKEKEKQLTFNSVEAASKRDWKLSCVYMIVYICIWFICMYVSIYLSIRKWN